jgi:chaperone modulatory protein CbpM
MPADTKQRQQPLVVLDEEEISLGELTRTCRVHAEWVMELVDEGVIEPRGLSEGAKSQQWRFSATTVVRVEKARRLQRDLGVNLPGVALALELLDRIDALEARLRSASAKPDPHDAD